MVGTARRARLCPPYAMIVWSILELERDFELGAVGFDLALGVQLQVELDDFGDAAGAVFAAPVVVVDAGRLPVAFGPPAAPVYATGSLTNLILSNGMATRCSPTPRKPPTPITTALIFPFLSIKRSLIEPRLSLLSL